MKRGSAERWKARKVGAVRRSRAARERQIAEADRALDELVYQLYELTEEEIGMVEGRGAE